MPDVFPHEIVFAWTRAFLSKRPLAWGKGLADMERQLACSLKACARHINSECKVQDLLLHFPDRFQELIDRSGDRLPR